MLGLNIPAPWPSCFEGQFLYITGDFVNSGHNSSGSIDIECHVVFAKLNSHTHCQIIKQSILHSGYMLLDSPCGPNSLENLYCSELPGTTVAAHELLIVYSARIKVQTFPGIEPNSIPYGIGDIHTQQQPSPRVSPEGQENVHHVNEEPAQNVQNVRNAQSVQNDIDILTQPSIATQTETPQVVNVETQSPQQVQDPQHQFVTEEWITNN